MSMKNIAIFPGSFDPFTNAHKYVVEQAHRIYDTVIILVSDNALKKCMFTPQERVTMIEQLIKNQAWDHTGVAVDVWNGLITDYAADYLNIYDNIHIIRGLRCDNGAEEFNLATTYYEDFGVSNCHSFLQTIMIPVLDKDAMNISSSRVREYIRRNKMSYVQHYCPNPIYYYIKNHQENSK